ncbi:hypothetical protein [Anabaena azotica]|uniref:Uncharacterized protein n=1 Tax=Anabaena azotica FACHB-119 TaxID=947527 RepID=A0ABR8DD65_9NOST|nr:hypothetical protein [Anabaena azotica]MBD2504867.1 hypothetical protein [Anabaena azotica FACHB-119]
MLEKINGNFYGAKMSEQNLDYVDRCIQFLKQEKEKLGETTPFTQVIDEAINIFENYKKSLPTYKPPINAQRMPPKKRISK